MRPTARASEDDSVLLTESEAARSLGFSSRTLQTWRSRGGGPPFIRISKRCVRYTQADLTAWIAERRRLSTSDDGADYGRS